MKGIGPLKKANNLPAAILYLKRRSTMMLNVEIPQRGKYFFRFCKLSNLFGDVHNALFLKLGQGSRYLKLAIGSYC